jgi:Spx/MgsR family transcriptional regulator
MSKPIAVYGLATCDTTRAARRWLDGKGLSHSFHDVREDGLTQVMLRRWVKALGWEKVLNKASTTWRELPEAEKAGADEAKAIALILAHPTLVKRPVVERGAEVSVGFKAADWATRFA